ncbi:hypothetical protein ES707_15693 [subsurface metagenome]
MFKRSSFTSAIITFLAPLAFANAICMHPIGPAPIIKTVSLNSISSFSCALIQEAAGSAIVA